MRILITLSLECYSGRVLYCVALLHAIFNSCVKLFVTYIRPILECINILWSPNLVYLIDLIESVQRKFTKRINSLASVPYSNRLNLLNLEPLELRRLHLDFTNYYKILIGLSPLTATDYFLIYSPITSIRSNMPSILRPVHASSKLSSSFFY